MPLLNNLLPEGDRIKNRRNLILYAEYVRGQTAYENGLIASPPTFKGDYTFFLKMKQGKINTEPSEQLSFVLSATPAPTPPSASSITIPQAGFTFVTVNFPASARATSYSYVLNGVPYTPAIDNGTSGSITLDALTPGTAYTLVITASGPSGTTSSPPLTIYTLPVPPLSSAFFVTGQTETGATINWSGAAGVLSYRYTITDTTGRVMTAADGLVLTDNGLSGNNITVAGLTPGAQYSMVLDVTNTSGTQTAMPYTIFTGPVPPPSPVPSAATVNGFTVPYPTSGGAASYTYTINGVPIAAAPASPGFTRSGSNLIFTGLTPGVPQDLVITAIGFTGMTSVSPVTRIYTTPVSLPSSAITKTSSGPSTFTLAWPTANSGATSYTYTVLDPAGNPVPGMGIVGDGVTGNTVSFTGLSPGVAYTMRVNSKNPSQVAAVPSASFTVYTAPAAATALTQSQGSTTQTSSTISWGGATGATGYTYVVRDASGRIMTLGTEYTLVNNGMVNSSATINGLTAGQTYSVVVIATDTFGQTSSTPITITTAPSTPTAIVQTAATQTSFTVSWTGGIGATSYSYTLNTFNVIPSIDNGMTTKTATFSGLNPGDSKDLIITARNSMGDSPSARVSKYALTGPPTALFSSNITSAGFTVNWLAPTGASSYTYTITNSSGVTIATDSTHLSTSGANYATFARLSPSTLYNVIVNADNPAPGITPSTTLQITTAAGPSQPTASSVSRTSAGFSINVGGGTGGTGTSTYTYTYTDASGVTRSITPTTFVGGVATFSGLPAGGSYVLHVVATDSADTPSPALNFPFTTDAAPAQPAISTTPTTVACGSVRDGGGGGGGASVSYTYILENMMGFTNSTISLGNPSDGYTVTEVGTPPVATITGVDSMININNIYSNVYCGTVTTNTSSLSIPIIPGGNPATTKYTLVNTSVTPNTSTVIDTSSPADGFSVTEVGFPIVATFSGLIPGNVYTVNARQNNAEFNRMYSDNYTKIIVYIKDTFILLDTTTTPNTTFYVIPGINNSSGIDVSVDYTSNPVIATFSGLIPGHSYTVRGSTSSTSFGTVTSASDSLDVTPQASVPLTTSVPVPTIPGAIQPYTYTIVNTSVIPNTTTTVSPGNPSGGVSVTVAGTPPVATFTGLVPNDTYTVTATGSALPSAAITSGGFILGLPPAIGGTPPLSYSYTLVNTSTTPPTTTLVTAANSPQNGITVTESGTPPVATFTGLASGAAYTVSVSITDGAGTNSPASTPVPFATLPGPAAPVKGTVTGLTPFAATVPFTTPGSGSTPVSYSYTLVKNGVATTVTVANSPQNGISVTESVGPPRTAAFTGLTMDTAYSVVINSFDKYGTKTPSSSFTLTTPPSTPTTPTSLTFPTQNIGNTTALVTWSDGLYATSYNFLVTTNGATVNATIVTHLMNGSLAPNSATISGLLAGLSYSVTIQSVNSFGSSSASAAASFTTTVLVTTFATGLLGPTAMTTDGTNLYVAQAPSNFSQDTTNNIMKIDSGGNVTPIVSGAARATVYNAGRTAITTQGGVFGITYVPSRPQPLIFTDFGNRVIKACGTDGSSVTTILGSGVLGNANGTGTAATFGNPYACTSDSNGILYISDAWYSNSRMATLANLTTTLGYASFNYSAFTSMVADTVNNNMWISNKSSSIIVQYSLASPFTTKNYYSGGSSSYNIPYGITMDMYGNVIVADTSNNRIKIIYNYGRSITYNGVTLTAAPLVYASTNQPADTANSSIIYAGSGASGFTNGNLLDATFNAPWGVQLSTDNTTLYVTDNGNGAVRAMPYVIHTIISSLLPVTPTSVAQIPGTPNQLVIGWSGGLAATSYSYLIKDALNTTIYPGTATLVTDSVANKSASFSGLTYGQTYTVTVTATNVNGSVSSTATSVAFIPTTYLFASGLDAGYSRTLQGYTATNTLGVTLHGITVDSNNNVYLAAAYYITNSSTNPYTYYSGLQVVSFTPSGIKTLNPLLSLGTSVGSVPLYTNIYNMINYSSVRDRILFNNVVGNTILQYLTDFSSGSLVASSLQMCGYNKLGYFYVFTGTIINVYNASNTLIGPISTLPRNTTDPVSGLATNLYSGMMTVDTNNNVWVFGANVINSVSMTRTLPCLRQFSPNGALLYTYTDITGGSSADGTILGGTRLRSILADAYGNLIIITSYNIYILYMSSVPFTYNGTTYTTGQIIPYAGTGVNGSSYTSSTLTSYVAGFLSFATLDTTGSILYVIDSTYKSIIAIPYLISKLPPTPVTNVILTGGTPTTLNIQWQGGIAATSYSYTFTDSSGAPVSVSVSTDNGVSGQNIILSGNFPSGFSFNVGITGTNAYGNQPTTFPITVTGFVSTFSTGLLTPAAIAFGPDNLMYVTQAISPTTANPNIISIAADGVTKTTIVSTFASSPSGLSYNYTLGLLMLTDSGNTRLYTSGLTAGTPTQRATGIGNVRGCVSDSYGNTYTVNTTTNRVDKFTSTYVQTTHITQVTGSFNGPYGITIDPFGNLWVADTGNNSVKKFTNAGALLETYTGFNAPRGVTSDKFGNIIVADTSNNVIKIIYTYSTTQTLSNITYTAVSSGLCNIYTYAGSGASGNANILLLLSTFNSPWGVQLDNTGTVLYIADSGNGRIRAMPYNLNTLAPFPPTQPTNIVNTVGTSSSFSFTWSGVFGATSYTYTATDSSLNPVSLTVTTDNGVSAQNVTLGGTFNVGTSYIFTIRATNTGGSSSATITTGSIAGFITNYKTGLNTPTQMAIGPSNTLYFAQQAGSNIFSITSSGTLTNLVTTFLGKPFGLCYNFFLNTLIMTDTSNNRIATTPLTGGDPTYPKTGISKLGGCAADMSGNTYFVTYNTGGNTQLIKLTGTTTTSFGPAYKAYGITIDPSGNLWVAHTDGNEVVKHDITGTVLETYTGFNSPKGLCSDYLGNIIVADSGNNVIKIIYTYSTPATVNGVTYTAGNVYTYAGSGIAGNTTTSFSLTQFNNPWCTQLDLTNTVLYVSDYGNNSIRSIPYAIFAAVAPTPGQPTNIISSSITATGFTINWTKPFATTSYSYTLTANGSTVTPTIVDNGFFKTNAVFSGLTEGTDYALTVNATNAYASTASAPINLTTLYTERVTTFAGTQGYSSIVTGPVGINSVGYARFIAIDASNNLYMPSGSMILLITSNGDVSIMSQSSTNQYGVCTVYNGTLYVCDLTTSNIYSIPLASSYNPSDPPTLFATLPTSTANYIAKDTSGNFYVSSYDAKIYKINSSGTVTLFKTLPAAIFGLALDNAGNIYYGLNSVSSTLNKLTQGGVITSLTTGILNFARGITISSDYTTLYIADAGYHRIIKYVISSNTVIIFAGVTNNSGFIDNTALTTAKFNSPQDVVLDSTGKRLFVTDFANTLIRKIQFN